MNDTQALLALLEENPDEGSLRAMTVDALIELEGYSAENAWAHVLSICQTVTEGRELAQATNLMRDDTTSGAYLSALVRRVCLQPLTANGLLVVVAGGGWPAVRNHRRHVDGQWETYSTWTVGARWVLRQWRAREIELDRRRQRNPRRTAAK